MDYRIRLYTFGCFAVSLSPSPDIATTQKKPIGLLRALAVFGGRNVSTTKLSQALWPNSDGDMAKRAFEITLHRLRKLIGSECVETNHGALSLNPKYCWLDVWEFEELVDQIGIGTFQAGQLQRLLDLYRGPLLDDADEPWVLIQRDRLRSKFLRTIVQGARLLEAQDDLQTAIACYQRGLEADPLAEELYRLLMHCYRKLNRFAEALATYQRCYSVLTSVLRVEPSQETKLLYESILKNATPVSRHNKHEHPG